MKPVDTAPTSLAPAPAPIAPAPTPIAPAPTPVPPAHWVRRRETYEVSYYETLASKIPIVINRKK